MAFLLSSHCILSRSFVEFLLSSACDLTSLPLCSLRSHGALTALLETVRRCYMAIVRRSYQNAVPLRSMGSQGAPMPLLAIILCSPRRSTIFKNSIGMEHSWRGDQTSKQVNWHRVIACYNTECLNGV